jgi:folate-binding protein YgfZ
MTPGERALRDGVAVVERVPRAVFELTGERPLAYLHDVLAQDVATLVPGRGAIAAVLTANGRVAAEVRVLPLGDRVLLDAEPAAAAGVRENIARHAPLAGVEVEEISDRSVVTALRGPNADDALKTADLPIPGPDESAFERSGDLLVVRVLWGVTGVDLIGPAGSLPTIAAERATIDELDAARNEAGRARYGIDMSEDLLVNETPLLGYGVSMTKGCYPGQESVARIHNLGRIRRALRSLRSDAAPLNASADVELEGAAAGRITSVAPGPDGGSVAIALLAAEIAPGTRVTIDGVEAVVGELP